MRKDKELALLQEAGSKVIAQLIERYGYWSEDKPVTMLCDDQRDGHVNSIQVSWECGPPQWALGDTYWMHEELVSMGQEFTMGKDNCFIYDPMDYAPFFDQKDGFFYEPYDSFTLSITLDTDPNIRG